MAVDASGRIRGPNGGQALAVAELGIEPAEQFVAVDAQACGGTGTPLQPKIQEDAGIEGLVPGERLGGANVAGTVLSEILPAGIAPVRIG